MQRFCIIGCLLAAVAGCDTSPATVTVQAPGHVYHFSLGSIQRIQQECGVSAEEAGSIAVARLKANELWRPKLQARYASYLKDRGSESQYQAEIRQLEVDFGLSRYEAIAEVVDFPELPELITAAQSIGLPQPTSN